MIFIKDIWTLQVKLAKIAGKTDKRANKLSSSSKFGMAFEFLLLRATTGDKKAQRTARWWHKYLAARKQIDDQDNNENNNDENIVVLNEV
jgi:hypothetical protein